MRRPLVIANWKMHGDTEANRGLVVSFLNLRKGQGEAGAECVLCPPYPYLMQVAELLASSGIGVGAQDCSHSDAGAYTGEVAAAMLADCGCGWVIVGHSERRQYHRESDALISAKLVAAQRAGLTPVLCVGETREQREAGEAQAVVRDQLVGGLADQGDLRDVVVAYEPVWAIGTGLSATPDIAQEMHAHVRAVLRDLDGRHANDVRLLYGGSVKADNAAALFAEADIDGALVGGASLDAEAFAHILAKA